VPISADTLPDDPAALKRIIAAMSQDAVAADLLIAKLQFQLARYRRAEFGRSSEKVAREKEQLELAIESLEATRQSGLRRPRRRSPWPPCRLPRLGHCLDVRRNWDRCTADGSKRPLFPDPAEIFPDGRFNSLRFGLPRANSMNFLVYS
jgi:hypothetical protein